MSPLYSQLYPLFFIPQLLSANALINLSSSFCPRRLLSVRFFVHFWSLFRFLLIKSISTQHVGGKTLLRIHDAWLRRIECRGWVFEGKLVFSILFFDLCFLKYFANSSCGFGGLQLFLRHVLHIICVYIFPVILQLYS